MKKRGWRRTNSHNKYMKVYRVHLTKGWKRTHIFSGYSYPLHW